MRINALIGLLLVGGFVSASAAGELRIAKPSAYVISRPAPGIVVAARPAPDQPIPPLASLRMATTLVLVDPHADYTVREPGSLDEHHSIVKAQREYLARYYGQPTRVIRRSSAQVGGHPVIVPRAIFLRPELLNRPDLRLRHHRIPTVPSPPKDKPKLMARALGARGTPGSL